MLEIKNLTIEIPNDRVLVENLRLVLQKNDKIGVIGEEGNGKSTLLKTIHNRGDIEKDFRISGEVKKENLITGYLEQSLNSDWDDIKVYEFFLKKDPRGESDYVFFEKFNELGKVFLGLGLSKSFLESEQKIGTLSGGEKVKIQIVKLLMLKPDVLLLDEPTNDLDIETLEWLEKFICNLNIPLLFISHDETLLENTANAILHLEFLKSQKKARHTFRKVGYEVYVKERAEEIEKKESLVSMEKREYKKDREILGRQKSSIRYKQENIKDSTLRRLLNKNMKNILVKEKKAEEKKKTERVETEDIIHIYFDEDSKIPNGKVVLDFAVSKLKIGKRVLAKDIKLNVVGPRKIAVIGENGIGKTTLIREVKKVLEDKDGIKLGYMPQNYDDVLKDKQVVLDYLLEGVEGLGMERITASMGRIKLTWEEMNGRIGDLSFGQKAKLMVLKMMLSGKNVLLLDEPTRNLSSLSNPVIRDILKNFKGCVVAISHDRKFLKEVVDVVYKLEKDGLKEVGV